VKDILGIVAVLLAFIAYIPYFRDILKKKTIPHPYSWLIWGLSSALTFGLSFSNGGGAGSWTLVATTIICLTIAGLAFKNGGRKFVTKKDVVLLIVALFALVLWVFADQPVLSISLLVFTDMIGIIPSLTKAWKKPYTETLSLWVISTFRHGVSITALASYNIVTLLDPSAWVIANGVFALVLIYRRRVVPSKVK
jgi:hypothetical protein